MYVADTGDPKAGGTGAGGIQKWVYNGSQWVLKYTLTNPNFVSPSQATTVAHGETGFQAIAGNVVGGVAYLYAVSYTAGDADPDGLYGITDSGATLNGSINPNGTDTQVYFEYGTSTSYGLTTSIQDLGSGTSPVAFNIGIGGLQAGTVYDYRLVTVANGLTSTYANQMFTTSGNNTPPPTDVDTPAMPTWALAVLALALLGASAIFLRRNGPTAEH
jgi:hypothetical protein